MAQKRRGGRAPVSRGPVGRRPTRRIPLTGDPEVFHHWKVPGANWDVHINDLIPFEAHRDIVPLVAQQITLSRKQWKDADNWRSYVPSPFGKIVISSDPKLKETFVWIEGTVDKKK